MRYAPIAERLADTGGAKWAVHAAARARAAQGADIIELTIGEPDRPPDPRLLEAASEAMRAGRTRYSNGRGEPALLKALAKRYAARRGDVDTRNILAFPGAQTALFATIMGLAGAGDAVMLGEPAYATYEGVIRAAGARPAPYPLRAEDGFRPIRALLDAAWTADARVLLLNAPHNPSGAVLDADDVAMIEDFCRARDLWLVCDEVYEALIFDDGPLHSPFDRSALAERVVAISSISKTFAAPGFRSGWAVGPKDFCEKLLPLAEAMLFGNQPFIADATAWALEADLETAALMRADYARRAALLADRLGAVDGLAPFPPRAGMFLLVDVSGLGLDGEAFAWALLDAGVAAMPGSAFGAAAEKFVRISLTAPDDRLAAACDRIAACAAGSARARR